MTTNLPTNNPNSDPDPNADELPTLRKETRPYIRIRPSTDPTNPTQLPHQLQRLHRLLFDDEYHHWLPFDHPNHATVEVLLIADGTGQITYQFGISEPALVDAFEGILRTCFPNTYEFERVEWHPEQLPISTDHSIAGVDFMGYPSRRSDWQTKLTAFHEFYDSHQRWSQKRGQNRETETTIPLANITETMATSETPMLFQALIRPYHDFTKGADAYRQAIESGDTDVLSTLINGLVGYPDPEDVIFTAADEDRLEGLTAKETTRSFVVNARAIVANRHEWERQESIAALASAFSDVGQPNYEIRDHVSTGKSGDKLLERIQTRQFHPPTYDRLRTRFPGRIPKSKGIVADTEELGSFCVLDGETLTTAGQRAIAPTPTGKTGITLPPPAILETYQQPGFEIGYPLTADKQLKSTPVAVPPELQSMHQAILGATGSGKTVLNLSGILANHAATDGASIIQLPKGGSAVSQYLMTHYAQFGSLDDVLYFDCSEVVPALSFFDIRDQLDAGIPRTTAVEDTADHYAEFLTERAGKEQFKQAIRSPDIIRYLIQALFDPVHGKDAFSHRDLHQAVKTMQQGERAPVVSDEDLERSLGDQLGLDTSTFKKIMGGVMSRIEKVSVDSRLARMFNHVAEPETDDESDGEYEQAPHFDLAEFIDEDVVIIIDTGGIRTNAQQAISLAILSNCWTALKRRKHRSRPGTAHPLVNIYIEEAASVAKASFLKELLAQGREFDVSVTLSMQFPSQLNEETASATNELLNNVHTIISGSVPADFELAKRLATSEMDAQTIADRLDGLRRGEWLVKLPGKFLTETPEPFLCQSLELPPGHPDGPRPFSEATQSAFESEHTALNNRTQETVGLELTEPQTVESDADTEEDQPPLRVDSALPHTKRLPRMVSYDENSHALQCIHCETRYPPDDTGINQAIECCRSHRMVESDDIPITDVNLTLGPEERQMAGWSDNALMFLQAVHNASQLVYDPPAYDLLSDSMIRLQEYVGVDADEITELIDAGLLTQDTNRPHRLYSLRPEGRKVIGQPNRRGIHHGHGKGDLDESSEHVLGVEALTRWMVQKYVEDSDSAVEEVTKYYELKEGTLPAAAFMGDAEDVDDATADFKQHRLDVAGLNSDGEIVIVGEVERINHDLRRAAPDDYDKMAACEPDEAIWVATSHKAGHKILAALNDPLAGDQRVEKTYAESSPVNKFQIDAPGFTEMYTIEQLIDQVQT